MSLHFSRLINIDQVNFKGVYTCVDKFSVHVLSHTILWLLGQLKDNARAKRKLKEIIPSNFLRWYYCQIAILSLKNTLQHIYAVLARPGQDQFSIYKGSLPRQRF